MTLSVTHESYGVAAWAVLTRVLAVLAVNGSLDRDRALVALDEAKAALMPSRRTDAGALELIELLRSGLTARTAD